MLRNLFIAAYLLAISFPAHAYFYPTAQELLVLPPYCSKTAVISKYLGHEQAPSGHDAETANYIATFGPNFWHLHHYCFGHMHLNRAYVARNSDERNGQLKTAIKEFDYVLRAVEPEYFLLPEIHANKGKVLLMLKEEAAAVAEFRKAIAFKPEYLAPYISLSDYYEDKGKKDLALQILEEGLTVKPEAKSLINRYKRLGGKKVFAAAAPEEKKPEPKAIVEAPAQPSETPASQPEATPDADDSPGNKPNPYCRFCP